ncbi:MAG TPA: hypothetical protein VEW74_02925 [Candidatus Nitrosotalea sp.]|nr:hypothetical protein [Candidatus Nitrosotalea sp.]
MTTEVTVKVNDVRELFGERKFDPFDDGAETIGSIAQMAQLPHLVSKLRQISVRVLVPAARLTPQTEVQVRRALERYSAHMVGEARRKLAAMRWVGVRAFLVGLVFFGISLAASAAVGRMLAIPEALRTLASESLIVAGWVVIWQPLDTLVQGWWPQWEEERTFRAIGALPVRVEAY